MTKINIQQIFYQDSQRKFLDANFTPLDNSQAQFPYNYEFGLIYKSSQKLLDEDELRGFVSWKFQEKTGINGERFKKFIQDNPDYDLYFINPFPSAAFYKSVWQQGEFYHQGLTTFAQKTLKNAGYDIDLEKIRNRPSNAIFCNFWVGDKKFWQQFMEFASPQWRYFETQASEEEKKIYASSADKLSHAPYSAYLFERMISTFLASKQSDNLRTIGYKYSFKELLSKYFFLTAILVWVLIWLDSSNFGFMLDILTPPIRLFLFVYRGFRKSSRMSFFA